MGSRFNLAMTGGPTGLPAEFLIAADGPIEAVKYGRHAYDQWSVEELLELARQSASTSSSHAGSAQPALQGRSRGCKESMTQQTKAKGGLRFDSRMSPEKTRRPLWHCQSPTSVKSCSNAPSDNELGLAAICFNYRFCVLAPSSRGH
jgi:hypothetical protein